MAREINLVPDSKVEAIRILKLRNLVLFASIIIASISVFVSLVAFTISGGQQAAIDGKKQFIEQLHNKIGESSDLNDLLTIKNQLGNLVPITDNELLLSRIFDVVRTLIPTNGDEIKISALNITLSDASVDIKFDAQANATTEPYIDYNVLDSFKKSLPYMHYDYGDYKDKYDTTIPAYCMIETNADGTTFSDPERGIYAFWTISAEGCDPSAKNLDPDNLGANGTADQYTTEEYEGQKVVKIWRTPQYKEWYKNSPTSTQPYMDLDGNISNVEHFESKCITHKGELRGSSPIPVWTDENSCELVLKDGDDLPNFVIAESSNGRDSSGELVLRFSATLALNSEVFKFNNHHMRTIPPSGRINVTDSYIQVQNMFGERAEDCAEDDSSCQSQNTKNGGTN